MVFLLKYWPETKDSCSTSASNILSDIKEVTLCLSFPFVKWGIVPILFSFLIVYWPGPFEL